MATTPQDTNIYGSLVTPLESLNEEIMDRISAAIGDMTGYGDYFDVPGAETGRLLLNQSPLGEWTEKRKDALFDELEKLAKIGVSGYVEVIAEGSIDSGADVAILTQYGLHTEYRQFLNLPEGTQIN